MGLSSFNRAREAKAKAEALAKKEIHVIIVYNDDKVEGIEGHYISPKNYVGISAGAKKVFTDDKNIAKEYKDAGVEVEPIAGIKEVDLETLMLAYIDTLDKDVKDAFKDAVKEIEVEVKQDGNFNAKTIKALDALVEEIKAK